MDVPNTSNLDDDMLDIDFISSQSSASSSQNLRGSALTEGNAKALAFIDATLNKIMSAVSEGLPLGIVLKRVTSVERSVGTDLDTETARSLPAQVKHRRVTYTWPGKTLGEEWRFSKFTGEAQFMVYRCTIPPITVELASRRSGKVLAVVGIPYLPSYLIA